MVELYNLLKTLDLPISYRFFKKPPTPPYIVYFYSNSENFGADNKVYNEIENYYVELYSENKDLVNEKRLENLFNENDIFYEKTETYIESEALYQVLYEI